MSKLVYKPQAHFVVDRHLKCVYHSIHPLVIAASKIQGNQPFYPTSTSVFWLFDTSRAVRLLTQRLPVIRLTGKEEYVQPYLILLGELEVVVCLQALDVISQL